MNGRGEATMLLKKASEDLLSAKKVIVGKKKVAWAACFHAQQSAEKALKAFLSAKGKSYPKTHDLVALRTTCESLNPDFTLIGSLCGHLNEHAIDVRYSDEVHLTLRDARQAIEAGEIVRFVSDRIPR
jgi:HEPN domain-containing protein